MDFFLAFEIKVCYFRMSLLLKFHKNQQNIQSIKNVWLALFWMKLLENVYNANKFLIAAIAIAKDVLSDHRRTLNK